MTIDKYIADFEQMMFGAQMMKQTEVYEYNRRLVELLRELKKLREIPDKLVPKYRDGIQDEYNRGANEMLEEVIDDIRKYIEEVIADE